MTFNPPETQSFQSTLPARGATRASCTPSLRPAHFNPRSLHGERRVKVSFAQPNKRISIHAPCTGSDMRREIARLSDEISIHAPCTGSDVCEVSRSSLERYFNPRSLHGERRQIQADKARARYISIHAPCTGSDGRFKLIKHGRDIFQSTLPARGATCFRVCWHQNSKNFNPRSLHGERLVAQQNQWKREYISIHAPCTGSDPSIGCCPHFLYNTFQSTLPARGATVVIAGVLAQVVFQSTLPARGATDMARRGCLGQDISIHAPCTGSDLPVRKYC